MILNLFAKYRYSLQQQGFSTHEQFWPFCSVLILSGLSLKWIVTEDSKRLDQQPGPIYWAGWAAVPISTKRSPPSLALEGVTGATGDILKR